MRRRIRIFLEPVDGLNLSVRSFEFLRRSGVKTIGAMAMMNEDETKRRFGRKGARELKETLNGLGLRFGMTESEMSFDADADVGELGFSLRVTNCFQNYAIKSMGDLVGKTADDLLRMNGFGPRSLMEVRATLGEHGMGLGKPEASLCDSLPAFNSELFGPEREALSALRRGGWAELAELALRRALNRP